MRNQPLSVAEFKKIQRGINSGKLTGKLANDTALVFHSTMKVLSDNKVDRDHMLFGIARQLIDVVQQMLAVHNQNKPVSYLTGFVDSDEGSKVEVQFFDSKYNLIFKCSTRINLS